MKLTCRKNFTLFEIIIVMMLFTLAVGLTVSSINKVPALVSMRQVVNELKQQCAEARRTASCQQRNVSIGYDPESGKIYSEETEILLPDDLKLVIAGEDIRQVSGEKRELFIFLPDGSGSEQKLILELDNEKMSLVLSPLTGRIVSRDEK